MTIRIPANMWIFDLLITYDLPTFILEIKKIASIKSNMLCQRE